MRPGLFKSYFGAICVPQLDNANGEVSKVTHDWAHSMAGIGGGLAVTVLRLSVKNREVGQAKEKLVEQALAHNVQWLFFVDDDVLIPPDALMKMIQRWKQDDKYQIQNGVYWSKSEPPQPLIFKGSFEGSYWNWHVGDLIEADAAGAGCTFVSADVFKNMPKPWFSTNYSYDDPRATYDDQLWQLEDELNQMVRQKNVLDSKQEKRMSELMESIPSLYEDMEKMKKEKIIPSSFLNNMQSSGSATEDLYFYKKAKEYLGLSCWVDTSIQCGHQDKRTGRIFGIRPDFPQAKKQHEITTGESKGKLLDVGCGEYSPHHGDYDVVRVDIDPEVKPDILADVRNLPLPDREFDVVFASHVLEHFGFKWTKNVLKEWIRVLKVGGELQIVVPNIEYAAEKVLKMRDGEAVHPEEVERSMFMYFSAQKDGGKFDYHKAGFTPASLKKLLESLGTLADVKVETSSGNIGNWEENPGNYNIIAWAKKVKHDSPVSVHENVSIHQQEIAKFDQLPHELKPIKTKKKSAKKNPKKKKKVSKKKK